MEGESIKTAAMKQLTSTQVLIAILAILAVFLGYNYVKRPFLNKVVGETAIEQASESAQLDIKTARIDQLSAADKVAQLLVVPVSLNTNPIGSGSAQLSGVMYSPETIESLRQLHPGVVLVGGAYTASDSAETIFESITKSEGSESEWPILIAINQASLARMGQAKTITIPKSLAQACQLDADTAAENWKLVAEEWQRLGVAMVFGPVLDLPKAGTVHARLGCASPQSAELAETYVMNFGQSGIMPVVAHFPGLGALARNPQSTKQTAKIALQDLEPFQEILQAYPNIGVLVSTLIVEEQFAGQPCALSADCLAQFPTKHPEALLIADQLTEQLAEELDLTTVEMMRQAIVAGNHLLVVDEQLTVPEIKALVAELTELYQTDDVFTKKVDVALAKIEKLKQPRKIDKPANGAVVPMNPEATIIPTAPAGE